MICKKIIGKLGPEEKSNLNYYKLLNNIVYIESEIGTGSKFMFKIYSSPLSTCES